MPSNGRKRGRVFAGLVMAGALLVVAVVAVILWKLEPDELQVVFPPGPRVDGWTPLFPPSESDGVEAVARTEGRFGPDTPILAVTVGSESRAYPLTIIGGEACHKVVNDTLGGQAIAVTF